MSWSRKYAAKIERANRALCQQILCAREQNREHRAPGHALKKGLVIIFYSIPLSTFLVPFSDFSLFAKNDDVKYEVDNFDNVALLFDYRTDDKVNEWTG